MEADKRAATAIDKAWLRGFTVALAILAPHGEDTIYDGLVDEGQTEELLKQARKDGAMRWSGLSGYVRRRRQRYAE